MTPRQLAQRARKTLRTSADPRVARSQKRFFKPWEKISLYGLKTPDVKRVERELYQSVRKSWTYAAALEFCDLLMHDAHLESEAVGLLLLERYHRQFEKDLLETARGWLEAGLCENWAATDDLATGVLWRLLDKYEDLGGEFEAWQASPNLWFRRAGIVVFVKCAGKGKHLDRAYQIVTALFPDTHDLIHKACGWLLREAGKADAPRLEKFLLKHGPAVPRTTLRYAIERFPEDKRHRLLECTR
ncbi:MAG TPA: DNA alkylation repair protein [Bryobacteraceae bacterium]|nr:DNA alkylation repair protein [Bryobacteraceae bacterium]